MADDQNDENRLRYGGREDMADILRRIEVKAAGISTKVDIMLSDYVSKSRFAPVERLVYGLVGLIMAIVVGALLGAYKVQVFH